MRNNRLTAAEIEEIKRLQSEQANQQNMKGERKWT